MVKDINGLGGYSSANLNTQGSKKPATSDAAPANQAAATVSVSDVTLSSEGKTLQGLADKVNGLPEINMARAEQIRQALQQGQYNIDDLVVADKLLNSEALLGS